ncbi:MFS transporter [Falsirhodobacter halotolerans]|uniref:MFS transporter n=1 Tax=Falsirhodobacter halotolerans TaxID=1146892 RepID=UPI001FD5E69A|nr:MFS transporter [Falsirhodobacter halotolerans]MCJ8140860.1 MFS transporter [Falsirhodobacter halotolerans]
MAGNRWVILAVVSSALLLIVIDMTVLYTALPRLTVGLNASPSEKLWIVNAYALTVAGLLPASGALGDRYGSRPMFLGGLLVFGAASVLAAFAPNPEVLIAGRVALAVGAAMMMPATLAIIRHTFEDEGERSFAIGVWAAVASGGAAFGPILGGVLLEFFWWGSVFLINVPIVLLAFVAAALVVGRATAQGGHPFSLLASVQIMIGLVATTLAIKEFGKPDPSLALAAGAGLTGIVFVALFIRGQRRAPHPMLDLRVFANPAFSSAVLGALIASAALMGVSLAMTQRFQLVLGLSPLEAGIQLLPLSLASFVAGPVTGRLLGTVGSRRLLPGGMAVIAGGVGLYLFGLQSLPVQIAALTLVGAGVGITMTTASASILHNAPKESAGTAASVEEVSYELGGALGVTMFGSILAAVFTRTYVAPGPMAAAPAQGIDAALAQAKTAVGPDRDQLLLAARDAFDTSFVTVLGVALALLILGGGLVTWMNTRR